MSLEKMHGKNAREWMIPKSEKAREFALDQILLQLNDASNLKVGTYVNINDKALRWVIKEAQDALKQEPTLLEL